MPLKGEMTMELLFQSDIEAESAKTEKFEDWMTDSSTNDLNKHLSDRKLNIKALVDDIKIEDAYGVPITTIEEISAQRLVSGTSQASKTTKKSLTLNFTSSIEAQDRPVYFLYTFVRVDATGVAKTEDARSRCVLGRLPGKTPTYKYVTLLNGRD